MHNSISAASHIIKGIGCISSCPKITHLDTFFSGSSFRPCLASSCSASIVAVAIANAYTEAYVSIKVEIKSFNP